jgi:hypothetical protein
VILVETSALVLNLSGPRRELPRREALVRAGERLALASLVL